MDNDSDNDIKIKRAATATAVTNGQRGFLFRFYFFASVGVQKLMLRSYEWASKLWSSLRPCCGLMSAHVAVLYGRPCFGHNTPCKIIRTHLNIRILHHKYNCKTYEVFFWNISTNIGTKPRLLIWMKHNRFPKSFFSLYFLSF